MRPEGHSAGRMYRARNLWSAVSSDSQGILCNCRAQMDYHETSEWVFLEHCLILRYHNTNNEVLQRAKEQRTLMTTLKQRQKMWWFGVVRGHPRSLKIAPFDRAHMSSY